MEPDCPLFRHRNKRSRSKMEGSSSSHSSRHQYSITPAPHSRRRNPSHYVGDGLDFRRPVMSTSQRNNTSTHEVIDLTGSDDTETIPQRTRLQSHAQARSRRVSPAGSNSPTRPNPGRALHRGARRPPRFPRDIIDLEEESYTGAPWTRQQHQPMHNSSTSRDQHSFPTQNRRDNDSDEIEFLYERERADARPPHIGLPLIQPIVSHGSSYPRAHEDAQRRATWIPNFLQGLHNLPGRVARHMGRVASRDPAFLPHITMDYNQIGFDLGAQLRARDESPPSPPRSASPVIEPLTAVRDGFTRSPQEDDILICPNCDRELCIGDEGDEDDRENRSSVWVARQCGHVYCGECAKNRWATKRKKDKTLKISAFSLCVVCGKSLKAHNSMVQLFL